MKKLAVIVISLFLACTQDNNDIKTRNSIKYYTLNSNRPETLILQEMNEKEKAVITYPPYVSQSYSLIRFILALMNKDGNLTVYIPGFSDSDKDIVEIVMEEYPLYGFNEFIELYTYIKENNIKISDSLESVEGKTVILNPEKSSVSDKLFSIYKKESIINIKFTGLAETEGLFRVIPELPAAKRVSSSYLENDKTTILVMYGPVNEYIPITPLTLYSQDNYLIAPEEFRKITKSAFPGIQINNMNSYLSRQSEREFTIFGE